MRGGGGGDGAGGGGGCWLKFSFFLTETDIVGTH